MSADLRILLYYPNWLGDIVMAHALACALKQIHPHAHIDVLTPRWSTPVVKRMPGIQDIIPHDFSHGSFAFQERRQIARSLKKNDYHQAFILSNAWKAALIPWLARIPQRISWLGESRWGLINHRYPNLKKQSTTMLNRYLCLADIPQSEHSHYYPRLTRDTGSEETTRQRFRLSGDQPLLAICPGAAYGPAKRWPPEQFIQVAHHFIKRGYQILCLGSQSEIEIGQIITKSLPPDSVQNLIGLTSLSEAIDIIAFSQLLLCHDSGLMHVGAALNTPLVGIYGSSSEHYTPPLSSKASIASRGTEPNCRPCFQKTCRYGHYDCLTKLPADDIIQLLEHKHLESPIK